MRYKVLKYGRQEAKERSKKEKARPIKLIDLVVVK